MGFTKTGWELDFDYKHEAIDETDLYGRSVIDLITRGATVHLTATLREYKAGPKAVAWPLGGAVLGKIFTAAVPVGMFASDLAQALVLTSTTNTSAAAAPATLTASKAWIAENYNPKLLFDSRLREIPIRMIFLPYASSTDTIAFSTT